LRGQDDPAAHCALNVALYGPDRRWAMTERSASSVDRDRSAFAIGPSELRWDGDSLVVDIDEVALPLPRRVRGRVRLHPHRLFARVDALDDGGMHRWGPIAPGARIEVELDQPSLRWSGHAYLDSNQGAEPIDRPFTGWDWSRAQLSDGSCAVIYDVRQREAGDRVLALRYRPDGAVEPFEAPARQRLARSAWAIARTQRSEPGTAAIIDRTLEDTPFYVRSVARARLLGEDLVCMHETLHVGRLVSPVVQFLLPFRMPRRP
jgi:carotenoid 1,2-hydratase